jgi:hypothetical protein
MGILDALRDPQFRQDVRSNARDFGQAASNTIAGNVSMPLDLIAMALRRAGIPVPEPVGGSQWMTEQGLTRDVPQGAPRVAGEAFGLVAPMAGTKEASAKIAAGLLRADDAMKPVAGRMVDNYIDSIGGRLMMRSNQSPINTHGLSDDVMKEVSSHKQLLTKPSLKDLSDKYGADRGAMKSFWNDVNEKRRERYFESVARNPESPFIRSMQEIKSISKMGTPYSQIAIELRKKGESLDDAAKTAKQKFNFDKFEAPRIAKENKVFSKGMGASFSQNQRGNLSQYIDNRLDLNKEGASLSVDAIKEHLQKLGHSVEHISNVGGGNSIYANVNGKLVRISDHDLPMTAQREHNRSIGLLGKWDKEVVTDNWHNTSLDDYLSEILGK